MELIRLLNAKHYDPQRGKFTSLAFKNSTGGGVSVVCAECVSKADVPICDHIAAYYPERVTGKPPIFWKFAVGILPEGWAIEQQTSESGDVCHYNIVNVSDRQLRAILGDASLDDFCTCSPSGIRRTQSSDVTASVASNL